MPTYLCTLDAEPTSAARNAHGVKSAIVRVCVIAPSVAEAELRARAHVLEKAWTVKTCRSAETPPEPQPHWDKFAVQLHEKASRYGLASVFLASPTTDGDPDGPIELRSTGAGQLDGKQH